MANPITLVLGGTRSGKSEVGERLVLAHDGPVLYLATGAADDGDADMAERIARHRHRRQARFETIETGTDLAAAVRSAPARPALVDALGTWLARNDSPSPPYVVGSSPPDLSSLVDPLVAALRGRTAPTVVVSDEVGLGVHPETEVGRQFRDRLGAVNQSVAAISTDVYLVVAGRVLPLSPLTLPSAG